MPQGLTSIGERTFNDCTSLAEISLPQGLTSIGKYTFDNCTSLTKVTIPDLGTWLHISYEEFSSHPFSSSKEGHLYISGKEVKRFIVPEDISSISPYAFFCCTGLEAIEMEPTVPPSIGSGTFSNINCYIYVWEECYDAYVREWPLCKYVLRVYDQSTQVSEPDAIDLGLSVKWASCNLGAFSPEEYGHYFAWGETCPKDIPYSYETYKWYSSSIIKYGSIDNKMTLDPEDDAAHVYLGGNWRMPTIDEYQELINNCSWYIESKKGVEGVRIKSKNGNNIFLPFAGYKEGDNTIDCKVGAYPWTSSLDGNSTSKAKILYANSSGVELGAYQRWYGIEIGSNQRWYGLPIRPVTE
ncbi:MAG: leucine-rich repeat domain-containing protein [Bacteroidales bacterium]|nr:leucine-rich repeat domain-containing protein [Bacteroidales bacterium]